LWDTALKPNRHWEEAGELAEDQLLTGLSGDRLIQELSDFARVKMGLESPDTGLTESSELLREVERFANGCEWIVVSAVYE